MNPSAKIEVQLFGGELDGDTFALAALGSIWPPSMLSYLHVSQGEPCWLVYEADRLFNDSGWPPAIDGQTTTEKRTYHFIGKRNLALTGKLP